MKIFLIGAVNLFDFAPCQKPAFWQAKNCPTQPRSARRSRESLRHALDNWDSARFLEIVLNFGTPPAGTAVRF